MAVVTTHDDLKFREVFPDKDFDHWRQPESPNEGKPNSPGSVQDKSSAGLKDLSRLTRKRRCYLSAKGARLSSRKRIDDKMSTSSSDMKTRFARKEPLPMKQRSLPQSFWLQPNSIKSSSMAQNTYSCLPPLFPEDHNPDKELIERPVSPSDERQENPRPPKRVVTSAPDTELLFSLFEKVNGNPLEKKLIKRGRPKKVHSEKHTLPALSYDDDPYIVENLTGRLFPQLSIESHRSPNVRLSSLTLTTGSNCIELPALAVENNYPQMLSQLAQVL